MFNGEQVVFADKLEERDPVELGIIFEDPDKEFVQKIRDLLKNSILLADGEYTYLLLGIENQFDVHMAMPVRNLIMDGLRYGQQISRRSKERRNNKEYENRAEFLSGFGKNDKLTPIITLVIYWKEGPWDGPRSLYDMFDNVDDRLKQYINDYKIHVIVPDEIQDFHKFKTELGLALEVISVSKQEEKVEGLEKDSRFSSMSAETLNLLNVCAGFELERNEGGEEMNVCKGITDLKKRERDLGKAEGKTQEFVNAIERVAKNAGGITEACRLYGTADEEYWRAKRSLVTMVE